MPTVCTLYSVFKQQCILKFSYDGSTLYTNRRFMENGTLYWSKIDHLDNVLFCLYSLNSLYAFRYFIKSEIKYVLLQCFQYMIMNGN